MTLTEALMLSILFFTCLYVTVTDLKNSIIQNKVIACAGMLAIVLNTIYYVFFAKDLFLAYCLNVGVMTFLSIAFYALHIWAAGDSKLLILTIMLIPSRIYFSGNMVSATTVIIIMIFSFAYIYTIIESIYIGIKEKNLLNIEKIQMNIKSMVIQYIKCTCLVLLFDYVFNLILPDFYSANVEFVMILNMIVIFLSYNIKFLNHWLGTLFLVGATVLLQLISGNLKISFDAKIYALVAIVLLLRIFSEKYNYQTIPTNSVKSGMVMAYSTVVNFIPSRVKGLPTTTTEDIRSKITQEEAENIKRWENSKYGKSEITIVRKIPFAIFISVGTIVYVIMRLILL